MATDYKKIEIELRELIQKVRNGKVSLYEIATRCVMLLNESDSYAHAIGMNPDDVLQHLNGFLRDFAVDLESVVTLLKIYPNREQWNRPLLDLLEDARASIRQEASADDQKPIVRRTARLADLEAIRQELAEKTAELAKVIAENERLIAANEKLTERVAKMEGQIAELRRLNREPVAMG